VQVGGDIWPQGDRTRVGSMSNGSPSRRRRRLAVGTALLLTLLCASLPAVRHARHRRELSRRLICASQMRGLLTRLRIYADEDAPAGEDPIARLVAKGLVAPAHTRCPSGGAPYILVSPSDSDDTPYRRGVAIYEPLSNHGGAGPMSVTRTRISSSSARKNSRL
jgi:hypothetical protein